MGPRLGRGVSQRIHGKCFRRAQLPRHHQGISIFPHRHQTDYWVPVQGVFQVALVDLRKQSPSFGARNTLYVGTLRPWQLLIPPGVAHGYKVIGRDAGMLVYLTDRFYNPKDEGRIAYNDPQIQYDWETQHK